MAKGDGYEGDDKRSGGMNAMINSEIHSGGRRWHNREKMINVETKDGMEEGHAE